MIPSESQTRAWMAAWRKSGDPVAGRALVDAMYPFVAAVTQTIEISKVLTSEQMDKLQKLSEERRVKFEKMVKP